MTDIDPTTESLVNLIQAITRHEIRQLDTNDEPGEGNSNRGADSFGWIDPPERSETVTHSELGGTIEDALEAISPDTELVLDRGPYEAEVTLPATDHVTISGVEGRTEWHNPGGVYDLVDTPGWSLETTSCSSIEEGAAELSVADASIFEPGDDALILDSTEIYQGMTSSDLHNTYDQYKGQLAVIEEVDASSDTITLEEGVHQPYPDPNGALEISAISWGIVDLHITGIEFYGGVYSNFQPYGSTDARAIRISRAKQTWLTDCVAEGWHKDLATFGVGRESYVADCYVTDIGRYGISFADGHTHGRVQDMNAGFIHPEDSGYVVQAGGGGTGNDHLPAPTYDIRTRRCSGEEGSFVHDAHFGAENVHYMHGQIDSGQIRPAKLRGTDQHVIGGEYNPTTGWTFQSTQVVRECSIEEVYVTNGNHGWILWPKEDQWFGDLLLRDAQFEAMGGDPVYFRETDSGRAPDVRGLHVQNVAWNGEWVDDDRIEACAGYDPSRIEFSTEHPSDQTPADYFG